MSRPMTDIQLKRSSKFLDMATAGQPKGYPLKLSDEDFAELPYIDKEAYIINVVENPYQSNPLTDNQFFSLPEDLRNKYVNLVRTSTHPNFKLSPKLLKRYIDVYNKAFEERVLPKIKNDKEDILNYLPPWEYKFLNDENKKIADGYLYESIKNKFNYLKNRLSNNNKYSLWSYNYIDNDYKFNQFIRTKYNTMLEHPASIFYIKKYIPKEYILNDLSLLKHMIFYTLSKSEDTFDDYMNFLGADYKKVISTFNNEEKELYNQLILKMSPYPID